MPASRAGVPATARGGQTPLTVAAPHPAGQQGGAACADLALLRADLCRGRSARGHQWREAAAGDIRFIDSSHVIRPWGDVLREFHEIIPQLKPGVLVHVHDIYTPRDYPEHYLRAQRRLSNEHYLLEAYLAFNTRAEIICAANWLKHKHFEALGRNPGAEPGAFWFVTR